MCVAKILVSIHASRAGRDVTGESSAFVLDGFQSTRPVRDATYIGPGQGNRGYRFNPRVPCGTRLYRVGDTA